jgi:Protein of unknown function (DUF1275)
LLALIQGNSAAVSIRFTTPSLDHKLKISLVIALTAAAMGLHDAVVRQLGILDLTTTVLTLTIAGLAADSSLAGGDNPRWHRRVTLGIRRLKAVAGGSLRSIASDLIDPVYSGR